MSERRKERLGQTLFSTLASGALGIASGRSLNDHAEVAQVAIAAVAIYVGRANRELRDD